jgi:hypothetical protein
MKKGLRSRIRALQCPRLDFSGAACVDLQRHYAEGFDRAVQRVLDYMDSYKPLPELLVDHVDDLLNKQVAEIHGDGCCNTVVGNAGFILACSQILMLVHEEHGDEIERARAIRRSGGDDNF